MAVNLSPVGGVAAQFFDNDGNVLSGGKIYTYSAGTTTPQTTYTTSQGTIAHANPIILDSAGRVPTGEIWLTDGLNYKFVLKDANDVLIATYDNISGINSNFVSYSSQQQIITATAGQTVFNLSISYQVGTNSLSVFVDGVNQYGPGAQYAYTETSSTSVTFTNGLHNGAVVKFTTTQQQGAGAVNASQVSYTPAGTGAVTTNVQSKLRQTVSVKDFGAVGDGSTPDQNAFLAAIQYATAQSLKLTIPAGRYVLNTTDYVGLSIDVGFMALEGEGLVYLDFSGATSTFAMQIFSSTAYPDAHLNNALNRVSNIRLQGGHVANRSGILLGNQTYANNGQIVLDSVAVGYFDYNFYTTDNFWRTAFYNCFSWNPLTHKFYYGSAVNSGEEISFYNCFFADGAGEFRVDADFGKFNFYGCSFGNCKITVNGSVTYANFFGCNLENPGGNTSYQYMDIVGTECNVALYNTSITWDTPATSVLTVPHINVTAASSTLALYSVVVGNSPDYEPEQTTNARELVGGAGRVIATGTSFWPLAGGFKGIVAKSASITYNADLELGNMNGWTVTPYGTAGSTAVASAAAKKNGSYGMLVTSVVGGGINVSQTVKCLPAQMTSASVFAKVATAATATVGYVQMSFLAPDGTVIATHGDEVTGSSWNLYGTAISQYAPAGTASVVINLNVQPGGNVVYFDDIYANIS